MIPNKAMATNYSYIPKPILEMRENPKRLKFVIKDRHIKVRGAD
ncbi:MAG: hypothetical protein OXC46_11625 [Thaumarchaeota archaeon]|nr:hypothetical protein [Nitrososphaerota archaeon]